MKKFFLIMCTLLCSACIFAQELDFSRLNDDEKYFVVYTKMMKKAQDRLVLMNKKGNMERLGEEEIKGLISGTQHYKTQIKGMGALITMTYKNYCDDEGWIFDGQIITKANMKADGTVDGIITVTGGNNGKIYYEKAILKAGTTGAGTYGVERDGNARVEIDYHLYLEAIK